MSRAGDGPQAVLFACAMNAVRSPMAAAIFRHLMGDRVRVASGGVRAGLTDPYAVAVMDEIGIDISDHEPAALKDLESQDFDLIITLSPEAHHHGVELTRVVPAEVEYWPTPDATVHADSSSREEVLAAYRDVRDSLFQRIKQRFLPAGGGPTV
ncbi:low molecular weight phosphatase family protein [Hyphomicrobium sp.]|uniref:arsenate-mycothiol transferase ArsC n=1 Tax=Hyphomicrobium sp. TaxID=82 RepID=UPI0025B90BCB|nr:low molecular weight phosphatase family protein [Hyphomicrobium sp.]MCC7250573.1 low molecular weight phosphatase family protein [Hyphomicrobium sp.]